MPPSTRNQDTEIKDLVNKAIQEAFSNQKFIDSITKKLSDIVMQKLEGKIEEIIQKYKIMEAEIHLVSSETGRLKTHVEDLNSQQKTSEAAINRLQAEKMKLETCVHDLEQNIKCGKKLRIYGMKNISGEGVAEQVVSFLQDKLGLTIKNEDIIRCYLFGDRKQNSNLNVDNNKNIVLVEFTHQSVCNEVLHRRKLLKNSGCYINEELTRFKLSLYTQVREKFGRQNVWLWKGNVYTNVNKQTLLIKNTEDLNSIELN